MSDLTRHGLAYRFNGIPIHSDPDEWGEQEAVGYVNEPKWNEADLTPDQLAEIDALVAEHLSERPQDDEMEVRRATLEWNGIEHTHRRGRPVDVRRPALGYECAMCKDWIMVKEPGDSPFYGGPLDGRWIVTGGRPTVYAPIPGGEIATYRRDATGGYRLWEPRRA